MRIMTEGGRLFPGKDGEEIPGSEALHPHAGKGAVIDRRGGPPLACGKKQAGLRPAAADADLKGGAPGQSRC